MSRPTVAMCMIIKNEAHHLSQMLQSVKGCFDQIVIVDTGSTDNSVEFLEQINKLIAEGQPMWQGFPEIEIEHFDWVDDFSKAREYSFSFAKTDYVYWQDGDDVLSDAKAFIQWRDTVMHSAHYWLAKYNYAFDAKGKVECDFIRERIVKREHGFKWKYFVHEGLVQDEGKQYWPNRVNTWWVNHMRSEDDKKADHGRNVKLLEKYSKDGEISPRMKFYQGKELVENGFIKEGAKPLMEAIQSGELEAHDRTLAFQYAAQSALATGAHDQVVDLLYNALKLQPNRAEYWCLLGDSYIARNMIAEATQAYKVALNSVPNKMGGLVVTYDHAYSSYPKTKLCEISMAIGDFDEANFWLEELKKDDQAVSVELEKRLDHLKDLSVIRTDLAKTEDVVITCPPQAVVTDWDENTLETQGCGGSETAAIEVARWIKKKTNRNVKIFHPRNKREVMPSGVEYNPVSELAGYIRNIEPKAHIAWRHTVKLTSAKTFVWCHDLQVQGAELTKNYDKMIALSEFHKNYLKETQMVPDEKILLGFNGINPRDFDYPKDQKDPLKVVFSSSPDRGLVQSIDIVKRAREISGLDVKLHCFYGTANMRKMGHVAWAEAIEKKIEDNKEFVIFHGFVPKKELTMHFFNAAVWIYPADFIETSCITAMEAMCASAYPIVRDMGALKYTMAEAIAKDMCTVLNSDAKSDASLDEWAKEVLSAITEKKYQRMDIKAERYSWERVGDFFIKELGL